MLWYNVRIERRLHSELFKHQFVRSNPCSVVPHQNLRRIVGHLLILVDIRATIVPRLILHLAWHLAVIIDQVLEQFKL